MLPAGGGEVPRGFRLKLKKGKVGLWQSDLGMRQHGFRVSRGRPGPRVAAGGGISRCLPHVALPPPRPTRASGEGRTSLLLPPQWAQTSPAKGQDSSSPLARLTRLRSWWVTRAPVAQGPGAGGWADPGASGCGSRPCCRRAGVWPRPRALFRYLAPRLRTRPVLAPSVTHCGTICESVLWAQCPHLGRGAGAAPHSRGSREG